MSTTSPTEDKHGDDFTRSWGFPIELKIELGAASYHLCQLEGQTYASGRPRFQCAFFDAKKQVVTVRDAMAMVGKATGKTYYVVRREVPRREEPRVLTFASEAERDKYLGQPPRAAPRASQPPAGYSYDDLFE